MALSHNHVPPYPKQFFISEMDNLPDTRFFLTLPSQYWNQWLATCLFLSEEFSKRLGHTLAWFSVPWPCLLPQGWTGTPGQTKPDSCPRKDDIKPRPVLSVGHKVSRDISSFLSRIINREEQWWDEACRIFQSRTEEERKNSFYKITSLKGRKRTTSWIELIFKFWTQPPLTLSLEGSVESSNKLHLNQCN